MKALFQVWFVLLAATGAFAQEPDFLEMELENLGSASAELAEDEELLLQFGRLRKHPLDINRAGADDLRGLACLSEIQVQQFLLYRQTMGLFIHVNELMAVPGWDQDMIRRLLPFIRVGQKFILLPAAEKAAHELLVRYSGTAGQRDFLGKNGKWLLRYRGQMKDHFRWGITAEKDAGELFFKGAQKWGFDFYSGHVFIRNRKCFQSIALGDYTVNIGQGLIHWQRLALGKSTDLLQMKRQSQVLMPYSSAGEFNFHRGAAATVRFRKILVTAFLSIRHLSATLQRDSMGNAFSFSAFRTSGLHRTPGEIAGRNQLLQQAAGLVFQYRHRQFTIGVNQVGHRFSLPMHKEDRPSNLFAFSGRYAYNSSIDYSWVHRQLHFFGEMAVNKTGAPAFLNGLLLVLDSRADVLLQWRHLSPRYYALAGKAITENAQPGNERGWLMALNLKPAYRWKWNGYIDFYSFPWLTYSADSPLKGRDYQFLLTHTPSRQLEWYFRYKNEWKQHNKGGENLNRLAVNKKKSWRIHLQFMINGQWRLRQRIEWGRNQIDNEPVSDGFMTFTDIQWKSRSGRFTLTGRWQFHDTDDYATRIYTYEPDMLYSYSLSARYGKWQQLFFLSSFRAGRHLSVAVRWVHHVQISTPAAAFPLFKYGVQHQNNVRVQLVLDF